MKSRCFNSGIKEFKHYGGRGITVCSEWLDFIAFKDWATSSGYEDSLSIERKDVNGNYCPDNCTWADVFSQRNNMRRNIFITIDGVKKTLTQWARDYNVKPMRMHQVYCANKKKGINLSIDDFKNAHIDKRLKKM